MTHELTVQEWEKRQFHYEDTIAAMQDSGSSFMRWYGNKFWPLFNEAGHTSLDFEKCKCKTDKYEINPDAGVRH